MVGKPTTRETQLKAAGKYFILITKYILNVSTYDVVKQVEAGLKSCLQ